MNITTITSRILCTVGLALLMGCDVEPDDTMIDGSELLDADAAEPAPLAPEAALDLTINEATASVSYVLAYEGLGVPDDLADGDVVMLKNNDFGYLGCSSGEPQFAHGPYNIDRYIWQVHEVDLDTDGEVEFQFELIDDTGPTNTFLKMNGQDEVFCDEINGIGDSAAWTDDGFARAGYGTHYRKRLFQLQNYKHGLCLRGTSSTAASGHACTPASFEMAFWVEIL